jgi:hypothetical protein
MERLPLALASTDDDMSVCCTAGAEGRCTSSAVAFDHRVMLLLCVATLLSCSPGAETGDLPSGGCIHR